MIFKYIRLLAKFSVAFVALAFAPFVIAQEEAGKIIDEINVVINGPKSVAKEAVLSHIRLRKGDAFNQNA